MVTYELGKWKASTLKTLLYVYEQNKAGKRPRVRDVNNGTMVNWIYALKRGEYIVDAEGFMLTEKGKQLLTMLQQNPPPKRERTKVESRFQAQEAEKSPDKSYAQISIRSSNLAFDTILPPDKAIKLVRIITEMVKKS